MATPSPKELHVRLYVRMSVYGLGSGRREAEAEAGSDTIHIYIIN